MIPKVSIVILNWNNWKDTIECLESLYQITYPNYEVILVDNNSQDDSISKIKEYCEGKIKVESDYLEYDTKNKPIKLVEYSNKDLEKIKLDNIFCKLLLIKNEENYGFTKGNNIAIDYAMKNLNPEYILLLNNDTVVDKQFLSELVNAAEEDLNIGFVGPKTYYYKHKSHENGENRDIIQYVGGSQNILRFKPISIGRDQLDIGQFNNNQIVEFIHGSCMLVRVKMLEKIGLFDEAFFTYREENDWCMRGKRKGWDTLYSYKSIIWHKGGGSTTGKKVMPIALYYLTRNRFLFMKKHASVLQIFTFLLYFYIVEFFKFFRDMGIYIYKKEYELVKRLIKYFLKAVIDGTKLLISS